MKRLSRKSIATFGQKRRGDYVRVLLDTKRERYEVVFTDASGAKAKRVFPSDRGGKSAAIEWAETFCAERKRLAETPTQRPIPKTTVRQLWLAYTQAPAYTNLRPKSRLNYTERFRKWQQFIGADALCETTTLHDVDQFIQRAQTAGMVINQIRQVLNVARTIYNWGQTRKLVAVNELALHRWKRPKDAVVLEPEEYTDEEFAKLLRGLSPQSPREWRVWVVLMLAGHQAQRANAILHLKWADIDIEEGVINWPPEFQKNGEPLQQPLTWEAVAAIETARWWVRLPEGKAFRKMNRHQRLVAESISRTAWVIPGHGDGTVPYTYQAMWRALRALEERAGVEHRPYRALHGLRKMVGGNVADRTGDARLAMEYLGDKDMKMAKHYLKVRKERLERAANAVSGEVKK